MFSAPFVKIFKSFKSKVALCGLQTEEMRGVWLFI
jgi:hypothetical protein